MPSVKHVAQPNKQPKKLMRRIRQEAKALGITQTEYLRLSIALSGALRESLKDSGLDAKSLLKLVESPIFAILLQSIGKTALESVQSDDDKSEEEERASANPQPPMRQPQNPHFYPQRTPQPMYPMYPMHSMPPTERPRRPTGQEPDHPAPSSPTIEQLPMWYRRPM